MVEKLQQNEGKVTELIKKTGKTSFASKDSFGSTVADRNSDKPKFATKRSSTMTLKMSHKGQE